MSELNEAERVRRAENAKRALAEFLDPAFDVVHEEYQDRLKAVAAKEPWAADKIAALANASRIVEEVKGQIVQLIYDGEHARNGLLRAERIEKLTPAKRRLINIGSLY